MRSAGVKGANNELMHRSKQHRHSSPRLLDHTALDFNGTAQRIDGARKFDQQAVTGRLDDAALTGAIVRSTSDFRIAFSLASVPSLSAPIKRRYPVTSAASRRSNIKKEPRSARSAFARRVPIEGVPLSAYALSTIEPRGRYPWADKLKPALKSLPAVSVH